jgi:hypothetical protein
MHCHTCEREIFETVALSDELAEFLTLEAYPVLIGSEVNA